MHSENEVEKYNKRKMPSLWDHDSVQWVHYGLQSGAGGLLCIWNTNTHCISLKRELGQ